MYTHMYTYIHIHICIDMIHSTNNYNLCGFHRLRDGEATKEPRDVYISLSIYDI